MKNSKSTIVRTLEVVNAELLSVSELLLAKQEIVNPNAKTKREIKVIQTKVDALTKESIALEDAQKGNIPVLSAENSEKLAKLTAIGITENAKQNGSKKSIFHPAFNNKADRTKCRNLMQNAIALFLLHDAKGKSELATEQLARITECAKKYYVASDAFSNYADYCTENMDENKKGAIKLFIETVKDYREVNQPIDLTDKG
jgi:hypothetical protein